MFFKRLNCLVQHLTNKDRIRFIGCKTIITQTSVDIDYLPNCIVLKLLQPLQNSFSTFFILSNFFCAAK